MVRLTSMGTRAVFIHVGSTHGSVFVPSRHEVVDFTQVAAQVGWKVFNVDPARGIFAELALLLPVFAEQVADVFLVDFEIGGADEVLLRRVFSYVGKYVAKGVGNDAVFGLFFSYTWNYFRHDSIYCWYAYLYYTNY